MIRVRRPCVSANGVYLSNSEDQFRMADRGAELTVPTFVLTRNFWQPT